jgi:dUTP pyrophosphatase
MKLNILKNQGLINMPAQSGDAGYDIVATQEPRVVGSIYQGIYYTAIHQIEYDTEIKIEPEKLDGNYKFYMLLYPRSSIIKTNLVLANSVGVIDSGYRGSIKVCFKYIAQPEDMRVVEGKTMAGKKSSGIVTSINPQRVYHEGDKIAQLIPCKHNDILLNYVERLSESDRGDGGFGSTGL